jgi:mono/diheme cytochrome c family protein
MEPLKRFKAAILSFMSLPFRLGLSLIAAVPAWAAVTAEPTKEQIDFFEQKIRPILADNCYQCHSEEQGKSKGGLTLDTKKGWEKGGEGGAVIVPGDVEKSPLYKAVTYLDEDLQMPPKSKGGKLSDGQVADLAAWIKMGAPDPRKEAEKKASKLSGLTDKARQHWAYQPVKNFQSIPVPVNKNQSWCRTPIDAFVLQKLEGKGMFPSPDADRETLLRRVTYDLTGLPPTYAEVEAFLSDKAPNAFEKVVDRLLASPSYGERWGRHWLDTARYSDTIGGDRNNRQTEYRYPDAWTFRDYVVKALNEDKPYTDFIIDQLAADKIPGIKPDDSRLAALGFLTVGERFRNVNDIINDRIDTLSKGFMGVTVACARCHDHMFDPIPTRDYYALHGVFASISEPNERPQLETRSTDTQRLDYDAKHTALVKQLQNRYYDVVEHFLGELRRAPAAYINAAFAAGNRRDEESLKKRNQLIRENKLEEQFVQYLQRGMQRNPGLWGPLNGFREGRGFKGRRLSGPMAEVVAEKMEAKLGQMAGDQAGKIAKQFGDRLKQGPNKIIADALAAKDPKNFDEALQVYVELFAQTQPQFKEFIAAVRKAESATIPGFEDQTMVDFLRGPFEIMPPALLTKDMIETAIAGWPNQMLGRARFNFGEINMLETSHAGAPAHAMIVQDKARPVNSPVFIRGQSGVRGDIVPRGFLEVLSPAGKPVTFTDGSGRMELAKCIADKNNPLTARVAVNRIWMHHFGEGIVRTPDDLGVMSEKPTHPELLDYLSSWFMENGWSQKKLHKFIVLSRVYQESTHTRKEYEAIDPENRLLWRANVRRLDFEAMRDSLLVFSGQLDRSVGGKPINLTDEPYSYRRSVYGYVDRGNLPELMAHFDFSDPDMPNSKRTSTVVPQQALFLMNSPMAVDIARKILTRPEVVNAQYDMNRIMAIYRIIFQRAATQQEVQMAVAFIQKENNSQEDLAEVESGSAPDRKGRGKRPARRERNDTRFGAIKNEGERVERKPLTPWETYVHALLFSNEAAYMN